MNVGFFLMYGFLEFGTSVPLNIQPEELLKVFRGLRISFLFNYYYGISKQKQAENYVMLCFKELSRHDTTLQL